MAAKKFKKANPYLITRQLTFEEKVALATSSLPLVKGCPGWDSNLPGAGLSIE
jgi:hypothetical protein